MKPEFLILWEYREATYTLVNQIQMLSATPYVYYPDILLKHPFPEKSITLMPSAISEKIQNLFRSTPPHLIFILIPGIEERGLKAYVDFKQMVEDYFEIMCQEDDALRMHLEPYQQSRRLTTSQKHRLFHEARLYEKRRELYPALPPLSDLLNALPTTLTVLERNTQFNALIEKLQCTEFFQSLH